MATTVAATLQTAWDYRWSRPAYRVEGVPEPFQPETPRTGERRCIDAAECEHCRHREFESRQQH